MVAAFNNWRSKYYKKQGEKWDAAIKIQTRIRIFHAKIELQRLKDLRDFFDKDDSSQSPRKNCKDTRKNCQVEKEDYV